MPISLGSNSNTADPPDDSQESRRRRDPEATRRAILDAAEELFTQHGPAATSLSQVAKGAGVTKSLIHHHFGSKDDLWEAVQERYFKEYFEAQMSMLDSSASDEELLRASLVAYYRFLQSNPNSVRFMTWTFAAKGENPCPSRHEEELFQLGIRKIKEAQEAGRIRSDLEPFFIIKTMVGMPLAWFQTREETLALLDSSVEAEDLDDMYLKHLVEVFFHGIRSQD